MPGILGIVERNSSLENSSILLETMIESLMHEKWYKVDKYVGTSKSFARIHLGVFNPEKQPVYNEDKTLFIFMDGKIYGYRNLLKELTEKEKKYNNLTEPEICLKLYEKMGNKFVEKLNGSFIIVINDLEENNTIILNDRYGLRPLYYMVNNNKLIFAPEVKAILKDKKFNREIDHKAVAEFFAFQEILGNKTFFKEIQALPPASILSYKEGKVILERYWDLKFDPDFSITEEEFVNQLVFLLKKSLKERMESRYRFGISLSGGLDSRLILAAIDEKNKSNLLAYTFGLCGSDEVKVARRVAASAGVKHKVIELTPDVLIQYAKKVVYLTDGMDYVGVSYIPYSYQILKNKIDVALDGIALEIIMRDYVLNYYSLYNAKTNNDVIRIIYEKSGAKKRVNEYMSKLFLKEYYDKIHHIPLRSLIKAVNEAKGNAISSTMDYFFLQNHVRRYARMGSVLFRFFVEELAAHYDNSFINLYLKIPSELRINCNIYKKVMKKLAPEFLKIPYQRTMFRVDRPQFLWKIGEGIQIIKMGLSRLVWKWTKGRILFSNRHSYVNFSEWMRVDKKLRKFMIKILNNDQLSNMINVKYVKSLIDEHIKGNADNSIKILYIITFAIFLDLFKPRFRNSE